MSDSVIKRIAQMISVPRWGEGSAHLHVWFQGRPARQLEFYGWGNVLWSQLVDPLPSAVLDANHQQVIAHLVAALEPPIS